MYYIGVLACRTEVKVFHFQIMSNSCRLSPPPPLLSMFVDYSVHCKVR